MIFQSLRETILFYVEKKVAPIRKELNMARARGSVEKYWPVLAQWPSALFCTAVDYTITKIEDAHSPFKVRVVTDVLGTWRQETLDMFAAFEKEGIDISKFFRTGGPFQTRSQTKTLERFHDNVDDIIDALRLYDLPEFKAVAPLQIQLLEQMYAKTIQNLGALKGKPELALVGKLPGVGTGWGAPIDTRQGMADHMSEDGVQEAARKVVDQFYPPLIAAQKADPLNKEGVVISIEGNFRGIDKGTRDDAEVVEAVTNPANGQRFAKMRIRSASRKTGVVPSSAFHNRGTDEPAWRKAEIWRRYTSKYHLLPFSDETATKVMGTKLATMPGNDPEERVWISADLGWSQFPSVVRNMVLKIIKPGRTLGADNLMLIGRLLRILFTGDKRKGVVERWIMLLESGAEFTMDWYTVVSRIFTEWAAGKDLTQDDFEIQVVGDDLQILIKRKYLEEFFTKFGTWLKVKGMHVVKLPDGDTLHVAFYLGQFVARRESRPDWIATWVSPRFIKTTPGPKVKERFEKYMKGQSPELRVGSRVQIEVPQDDQASVAEFWKVYREAVWYIGSLKDYLAILADKGYWKQRKEMARQGGVSEWLEEEDVSGGNYTEPITVQQTTPIAPPEQPELVGGPVRIEQPAINEQPVDATKISKEEQAIPAGQTERVLVVGPPGCGKTTIAQSLGDPSIDLDHLGTHEPAALENRTYWIVRPGTVKAVLKYRPSMVALGNCDNMFDAREVKSTPYLLASEAKKIESIAQMPEWTKKIYLWYDPTAEGQREKRFGANRENRYGKDDVTWEKVKENAAHRKLHPPEGFEFIDTTDMTVQQVIDTIQRMLTGAAPAQEEQAQRPAAPSAEEVAHEPKAASSVLGKPGPSSGNASDSGISSDSAVDKEEPVYEG